MANKFTPTLVGDGTTITTTTGTDTNTTPAVTPVTTTADPTPTPTPTPNPNGATVVTPKTPIAEPTTPATEAPKVPCKYCDHYAISGLAIRFGLALFLLAAAVLLFRKSGDPAKAA